MSETCCTRRTPGRLTNQSKSIEDLTTLPNGDIYATQRGIRPHLLQGTAKRSARAHFRFGTYTLLFLRQQIYFRLTTCARPVRFVAL
jgi:hypothetical protein